MTRTHAEIDAQLSLAIAAQGGPSRWPGMTYEEGVDAALRWALGESDDAPMADEDE